MLLRIFEFVGWLIATIEGGARREARRVRSGDGRFGAGLKRSQSVFAKPMGAILDAVSLLISTWVYIGSLLALVAAGMQFYLVQRSGSPFIDSLGNTAYTTLIFLSGLSVVGMFFHPRTLIGLALAPFIVWSSASAFGSLLGYIVHVQGFSWMAALALAVAALGAYVWYATLSATDDEEPIRHQAAPAYSARPNATPNQGNPGNQGEQAAAVPTFDVDFAKPRLALDGLAGMSALKAEIRAAIKGFANYAKGAQGGAATDRNGILLSGPPGNGKTAMAEAIAGELGLQFLKLSVQDLTSKWVNDSPGIIRAAFRQAATTPCVLFLDEFDAVAAKRSSGGGGPSEDRKVVNALLSEIDSARDKHIVLIAATNFPEDLDPAISRDGRFDFRIEIPYPDLEARVAILTGMLKKFKVKAEEATIKHVAQLWERRSVSFIEATTKRLRDDGMGKSAPASVEDFKSASRAASRKAGAIPSSGAKLSEIALPADVRQQADKLLYRLRNWESIAERGGDTPSGVLLYGPPGTGKTNFLRALARELGTWHVFEVNSADVIAQPRKFRDVLEQASNHRPAFIFLDEADELLRNRNGSHAASATNEILKAMDGMMGKVPEVVFFAATNNMDIIDAAALRGGRFAEKIYMPRLSGNDLEEFLDKELEARKKRNLAVSFSAEQLARELKEIAPADALSVIRSAANYTFSDKGDVPLSMDHIKLARRDLDI